jgi:hypothetical protein
MKKEFPNILLIAGDGRNVGKTTLACKIINKFSWENEITGLKITPHFHPLKETDNVIIKNENIVLVQEQSTDSHKDSSLMLQSGASKVYYLQVHDEYLSDAFESVVKLVGNVPIVCESGGLGKVINPGVFLFVRMLCCQVVNTEKYEFSELADKLVTNNGSGFDFSLGELELNNNNWNLIS